MDEKTTREKLQVLLPHWLEHNHGHAHEFRKWADAARQEGLAAEAGLIDKAIAMMHEADVLLSEALVQLGGPAVGVHHHHHGHDHGHDHHHE